MRSCASSVRPSSMRRMPLPWIGVGAAAFKLHRYDDAVAAFERAVACDPAMAEGWNGLYAALWQVGRTDEALAAIARATTLDPTLAAAWYNQGNAYLALRRYAEATAAYEHALALEPTHPDWWQWQAYALGQLQRYDDMLHASIRALELDATDTSAWKYKGEALEALKRSDEAAWLPMSRRFPLIPPIWTHGVIASIISPNSTAIMTCSTPVTSPWRTILVTPMCGTKRATRSATSDRLEESLAAFEQATTIDPDYAVGWQNQGRALVALKRYDEALAASERVIALQPGTGDRVGRQSRRLVGTRTRARGAAGGGARSSLG